MSFRPHEVEPTYKATFPTTVIADHDGFISTGVRTEMATPDVLITSNSADRIRLNAAKDELIAEVDRIQKRVEIRGGEISEGDAEVLSSLKKVLNALDPNDSELLTRINTLLKS